MATIHIKVSLYDPISLPACGASLYVGDKLVGQTVARNLLFRGPGILVNRIAGDLCIDCLDSIGHLLAESEIAEAEHDAAQGGEQ